MLVNTFLSFSKHVLSCYRNIPRFKSYSKSFAYAELPSLVGSEEDLRTGSRKFEPQARPIFFPRIDDSHCDRIHSSLTAVHCFDDRYVGNQLVDWKDYYAKNLLKNKLQNSIDSCTCPRDIIEILLITGLNTIQSICYS